MVAESHIGIKSYHLEMDSVFCKGSAGKVNKYLNNSLTWENFQLDVKYIVSEETKIYYSKTFDDFCHLTFKRNS